MNRQIELYLAYYDSARQELISRIAARDNTLIVYLGGLGTLVTMSIRSDNAAYLLIMPLLSLGIGLIISHHHAMIGALALYCSKELPTLFPDLNLEASSWDSSKVRMKFVDKTIRLRYFGDIFLICIPPFISLFVNKQILNYWWGIIIATGGTACSAIAFIIIYRSYKHRRQLFKKMKI